MAKPHDLSFWDWNTMLESFHNESDRGAAVLVGGFVENYLGIYLRSFVVDSKVANDLFQAVGPLSSFSQRIAVARAFGFISKKQYDDLTLIRKIRNHFAHHPLDASFSDPPIAQLATKLSELKTAIKSQPKDEAERNRRAYLFSCGMFCGGAYQTMKKRVGVIDSKTKDTDNADKA
jgi:hypothetical protein